MTKGRHQPAGLIPAAILFAALAAAPSGAASFLYIPGADLAPGEDLTQVITIGGIDPLADTISVSLGSYFDYGIDWWEDFGDGFLIWGNEYFDTPGFTLLAGEAATASLTLGTSYFAKPFFGYLLEASMAQAADGYEITVRGRLGAPDQRCPAVPEASRIDFETCGIRPFSGYWETDIIVSGPNEATLTLASRILPTPTAAIPEPASWALLITGFGLTGFSLRRRRDRSHLPA